MRIRTIRQLKVIQSQMLDLYKQGRIAVEAATGQDAAAAAEVSELSIGRIEEVVSSDEQHGSHMKVALQQFAGSPPTPADANGAPQVYYPAPGRTAGEYALDEFVGLIVISNTRIAVKL